MKILILSHILPPAGGAEKVAWDISNEYAKEHEVHLFVMGETDSVKVLNSINVYFFKSGEHNLKYYLSIGRLKIKKVAKKINPDLIHAHAPTIFAFILRKYTCKKIITFHHSEKKRYNWTFIQRKKFEYFENSCVKNFDVVTTVSKHMSKYFKDIYKNRVNIIPNGIDSNVFYNTETKRERNSIIYIGQLTIAKGVDKLLNLANLLPNYSFVFQLVNPFFFHSFPYTQYTISQM